MPLLLDAYLPAGGGRHPAIVFVHGGGFRAGDKWAFAPGEEAFAATGEALARRGFAVFSIKVTPLLVRRLLDHGLGKDDPVFEKEKLSELGVELDEREKFPDPR